ASRAVLAARHLRAGRLGSLGRRRGRHRRTLWTVGEAERQRAGATHRVIGLLAELARRRVAVLDLDDIGPAPGQRRFHRALLVGLELALPARFGDQLELGLGQRLALVKHLERARLAGRHDVERVRGWTFLEVGDVARAQA